MAWIKVEDGYVDVDSIIYIRRSAYMYDNKYRLIFDLSNGSSTVYDKYNTKEECEADIDKLVNQFLDEEEF